MRAGRIGPPVPVPHEDGAWMSFRILSARELDEAEHVKRQTAMDQQLEMANKLTPERLQALKSPATEGTPSTDNVEDSYDKATLIKYGLHACAECDPCADDSKADLDPLTRDWAVKQILEMNVRPLAIGNDSERSSLTENSHRNSESLTASILPE
jgi:hypothetical protein